MSTVIICGMSVRYCSPTFNESSNDQRAPRWPAPNNITETLAVQRCSSIIVNRTLIGPLCVERLANKTSPNDVVQACVNDVQV